MNSVIIYGGNEDINEEIFNGYRKVVINEKWNYFDDPYMTIFTDDFVTDAILKQVKSKKVLITKNNKIDKRFDYTYTVWNNEDLDVLALFIVISITKVKNIIICNMQSKYKDYINFVFCKPTKTDNLLVNSINKASQNINIFNITDFYNENKINIFELIHLIIKLSLFDFGNYIVNHKNNIVNLTETFMNRKSVIIVGNGKKGLTKKTGKKIDSFDCVVRMNKCRIKTFEKIVGKKITDYVLGTTISRVDTNFYMSPSINSFTFIQNGVKKRLKKIYGMNMKCFLYYKDDSFMKLILNFFTKKINKRVMSTGFYTILFYLGINLKYNIPLSIVGFSCYDTLYSGSKEGYYYVNSTLTKQTKNSALNHHNFDIQATILNTLVKNNILFDL